MKHCLLFIFVGFSLLLAGCSPPATSLFIEGKKAYELQNYHTAYKKLLACAKANNHQAQYTVGYMYYYGIGVKQNTEHALYWFKKAADFGNYNAMRALALIQQGKKMQP